MIVVIGDETRSRRLTASNNLGLFNLTTITEKRPMGPYNYLLRAIVWITTPIDVQC